MDGFGQFRKRLRKALAPALCLLGILYFAFHAVEGDHGLMALARVHADIRRAELDLEVVRREKAFLEARVDLLRPDRIDRDMLDERARIVLGLSRDDEIVIYTE